MEATARRLGRRLVRSEERDGRRGPGSGLASGRAVMTFAPIASDLDLTRLPNAMTVWPSGLRRWLKAPFRKGVGSSPTAVMLWRRATAWRLGEVGSAMHPARAALRPPRRGREGFAARLAQSAERKALNLVVVGSSPTVGARFSQAPDQSLVARQGRWPHFATEMAKLALVGP